MKINVLYILILISCTNQLLGQEDESSSDFEVGISVSGLIQNVLRNEPQGVFPTSSSYLLAFKSIKNRHAFRFGFGLSASSNKFRDVPNEDKTQQRNVRLRLGYEYQHPLSEKWQINIGVDGEIYIFNSTTVSSEFNGESYSLSPFLGIQFNINKRINIQTLCAVNFFYQETTSKNQNNYFPVPSSQSYGRGIGVTLPQEVFINFVF